MDFVLCRRDKLTWEDAINLASFLGEQLHYLHLLSYPPPNISSFSDIDHELSLVEANGCIATVNSKSNVTAEWWLFTRTLTKMRKDVSSRLTKWYNLSFWPHDFLLNSIV